MINRQEFVKRWARALESRGGSVLIGAGLSISAGYPDWRTLLRDVAKELGLDITNETDLAAVAQYSINKSAGSKAKMRAAIVDHFPPKADAPRPFKVLARLPLRHVWTTNYDTLIETAWQLERKLVDVKSRNADLGHEMPWAHTILYKMHGSADHPADVVIAKDDYELYRKDRPGFLQLLAGHLVSMEMLFLGFSFTDPNLSHLFSSIREAFRGDGPRHYAIVRKPVRNPRSESSSAFRADRIRHALWIEDLQRYGIECLEIDNYSEIEVILSEVEMELARSSVLVSGSFPVGSSVPSEERAFIEDVSRRVGTEIAKHGKRLVSGYGLTVGSAAMSGALTVVLGEPIPNLERSLLLRPFPRETPNGLTKKEFQKQYREAMIRQAGVCIFIAGYKEKNGRLIEGEGTLEEFEAARNAGRVCIPIASTGHAAAKLWGMMDKSWSSKREGYPKSLFNALNKESDPKNIARVISSILDQLGS